MAISTDEFIQFCERTIDGMQRAITELDDDLVNRRPVLDGANSPFALVSHALGATRWWTEHVVLGLSSGRDRAAEFEATGTIDELMARCDAAKSRLTEIAPDLARTTTLGSEAITQIPLGTDWTVGAALMHTYEELAQHLGHLEITVDLVSADC